MERLQFHSLLRDELFYEVTIRSETPASTVDGMRKQLRQLLLECPPEAISETDFSGDSELGIIETKLQDLSTNVNRFIQMKDRHSSTRSKALGNHLHHRLLRIKPGNSSEILEMKTVLTSQLESLLAKLENAGQSSGTHSSNDSNLQGCSSSSTQRVSEAINVVCSGNQNVAKWNLRYNGNSDPRSFLERVDELKSAYGVSDVALFCSAAQLFTDNALFWFRGIKDQVSSWTQLKDIFLNEFDTPDYDYRLLGEIRSRTQGFDEPIHIYVAIMSCMFSRLKNGLSEESKLEILLHNIRPSLSQQLALINITSIAELKENCRKLEAANVRAQLFVEPPKSGANTLSNDFAYKGRAKQVNSVNVGTKHSLDSSHCSTLSTQPVSTSQQRSNVKPTHVRETSSSPVCYRCGKTNHNFKFCKEKRNTNNVPIKCFGCGNEGVIFKDCGRCQSQKERSVSHNPKNL